MQLILDEFYNIKESLFDDFTKNKLSVTDKMDILLVKYMNNYTNSQKLYHINKLYFEPHGYSFGNIMHIPDAYIDRLVNIDIITYMNIDT